MILALKLLFFFPLIMILYVYIGYPLLTMLLSILLHKGVHKRPWEPHVSILIAAYNESEHIRTTIQNKLDLDYPAEKLEIIVISDGSTDGTDEVVKDFHENNVKLLRQAPRAGKTSALNMAVPYAKGAIIVFSDANSIYDRHALRALMANFNDQDVGYITGKMVYTTPDGAPIGDGCSAYMKYENYLRSFETKVGSIVGVDGGIDAIRKKLYKPMNSDQLPDFVLPLKVIDQGYRVIYEPQAILQESSLNDPKDEYKMRVRVALRALWALWDMRHLLTFKRFSSFSSGTPSAASSFSSSILYAWQLWSHKVLRYLCFIFLLAVYFSNFFLWQESLFYKVFFILQNLSYLGAILFPALSGKKYISKALYLFHYFTLLNIASAHAFFKFIFGQKQITWTPRKG